MATRTDDLWVLDTSVVVAWLSPTEDGHSRAVEVIRDVRDRPGRYVVPHLLYSEMANVLARKLERDTARVRDVIVELVRFGLSTLALSEAALLRMTEWSCTGLGGYDATFVALAEDLGGRWLTADGRAAKIADEHAVTVLGWTRIRNARA